MFLKVKPCHILIDHTNKYKKIAQLSIDWRKSTYQQLSFLTLLISDTLVRATIISSVNFTMMFCFVYFSFCFLSFHVLKYFSTCAMSISFLPKSVSAEKRPSIQKSVAPYFKKQAQCTSGADPCVEPQTSLRGLTVNSRQTSASCCCRWWWQWRAACHCAPLRMCKIVGEIFS